MKWSRYKERHEHDRVMYQIVRALGKKFEMNIPVGVVKRVGGQGKLVVLEKPFAKVVVDNPVPTDSKISERRPDIVLTLEEEKRIELIEVAVAWEPLINDEGKSEKEQVHGACSRHGVTKTWMAS